MQYIPGITDLLVLMAIVAIATPILVLMVRAEKSKEQEVTTRPVPTPRPADHILPRGVVQAEDRKFLEDHGIHAIRAEEAQWAAEEANNYGHEDTCPLYPCICEVGDHEYMFDAEFCTLHGDWAPCIYCVQYRALHAEKCGGCDECTPF